MKKIALCGLLAAVYTTSKAMLPLAARLQQNWERMELLTALNISNNEFIRIMCIPNAALTKANIKCIHRGLISSIIRNFSITVTVQLLQKLNTINAVVDTRGNTLLHYAALHNRLDIISILLARGAIPYVQNNCSKQPIAYAQDPCIIALLQNAQQPPKRDTDLHAAVFFGNDASEIIRLLNNGADINAQDPDGNTALHIAAKLRHKDMIRLLMSCGASHNIQNNEGQTPSQLYSCTY